MRGMGGVGLMPCFLHSSYPHESVIPDCSCIMERPAAATPQSARLRSQAKEVIYNVNRYFLDEKANRGPLLPVTQALARTASATKVSQSTVKRICSKLNQQWETEDEHQKPVFHSPKKTQPATVTNFDDFDQCVLRRTVLELYERKEIPTVSKITEILREKISYKGSVESLRKVLLKIGFKFSKIDGRKFLMERSDVALTRTRFLRQMRQCKQSFENYVYLDETWVNQNYTVGKCWIDTSSDKATGVNPPTGKGSRLIIVHAGTKEGFVPNARHIFQAKNDGDYHKQMNATVFQEWFETKLLPNIPQNSVIVMDNASYHSVHLERNPTTAWRKEAIKEWLIAKGAQPRDDMLKVELYDLAKKLCNGKKTYVIDAIAAEAGHKVVRLPPYHCQYNPIELIWAQVKCYVAKKNTFKSAELKPLVEEAVDSITPENWKQAVRHAEELQEQDARQDIAVERFVESFVVNIEESSDDELSE